MSERATIGHTAVKVKDITGTIALLEDLLDFTVIRRAGEGETPSNVWFEEGLQLGTNAGIRIAGPHFLQPGPQLGHVFRGVIQVIGQLVFVFEIPEAKKPPGQDAHPGPLDGRVVAQVEGGG